MKLVIPRETRAGENRVALVPESCKKLVQAGVEVVIETGAGAAAGFLDDAYREAGAQIGTDAATALGGADIVFRVQPPGMHPTLGKHEVELQRGGTMLLGTLYPTRNTDVVRRLVEHKLTAWATDCIPRTTRAQTMDTLSSQANISGYKGVLLAAIELGKYFPMMMTAAGTAVAARVFVVGAGVAGLQAIATAKRLGAIVTATDVRPEVKEQIESVGGRYVGVQTSESATDAGGYAKQLSADYYKKQAELLGEQCAASDVVITTALIGGVTAPKLITAEMVRRMKPGAVLVDLAAEGGGNCELTKPGETVLENGVRIVGPLNLPGVTATHASMFYSRNLTNFLTAFWKDKQFNLDWNDEILKKACITHDGAVVHEPTKNALGAAGKPG
ncbi:MAG: Re/Si-specific NAD(P)(+) transhydrogenase subunit alpha [Phycisphaerae bacterium]